jgi:hypothetical protein
VRQREDNRALHSFPGSVLLPTFDSLKKRYLLVNELVSWVDSLLDIPAIEQFLQNLSQFQSVEDLNQFEGPSGKPLGDEFKSACHSLAHVIHLIQIYFCFVGLFNPVEAPARSGDLRQRLRVFNKAIRLWHGIQQHRPPVRRSRDRDLWLWVRRQNTSLSWKRVAQGFGMTPKAAVRAYERQALRELKSVAELRKLGRGYAAMRGLWSLGLALHFGDAVLFQFPAPSREALENVISSRGK